jgi:hypothetical protein
LGKAKLLLEEGKIVARKLAHEKIAHIRIGIDGIDDTTSYTYHYY